MKKKMMFFKSMLLVFMFLIGANAWGQTTIAIQDFETTPATPTWNYSATGGGTNSTTSKYNGAQSYRLESSVNLTMNNIDISGYTSVVLSVAFAGAGPDSGEDLYMDISYDNGLTWTGNGSIKLVDGYSNTPININTTNASNPTTVGSNPWLTYIGASETQISVRFRCVNLDASEYYFIDDVKLTGAVSSCTTPTYSFASSNVSKLTTDAPFTNTFTSDNTSAKAYTSSNTGVATINATTGEVSIVGAGTTTIGVTQVADATYCSVSASYELTVTAPPAPDAPVATAATVLSTSGFTANWNTVSGATGYRLDVYTKVSGGNATDLFISEYIEGSNSNKYIEIYNGTGSSVDLSNYKLQLYGNGSATTTNDITLSGTLANGATVVYQNSSASLTLPDGVTASNNSAVNFNGDDAVALYKISTSSYVDIFGKIGEDPGSVWGTGDLVTAEKTLVRKSSVSGGVTTNPSSGFPTLSTEWDSYAQNTVSYLGSHTFSGGSSQTNVSGYDNLDVANVITSEITGLTAGTEYFYVVRAYNVNGTSANSNEISVTTTSPTFTGTGEWSETARWNTSSVPSSLQSVVIDGSATLNSNVEVAGLTINSGKSLTVNAAKQLTVSGALTNNGTLTLQSTTDGTATLKLTGALTGSGSATVQQYLTNQSWYLTSPVTGTVTPTNLSRIQGYNEGVGTGNDWSASGTTMTAGKGYITTVSDNPKTVVFTGSINSGNISIPLTRQAATNENKYGFNLIGNPYTAYLDWKLVSAANSSKMPTSTMWYRTKVGGSWGFSTMNGAGEASPANVSYKIPPMQAFWVRASTVGNSTLDLTPNMLADDVNSNNKLKAPAAQAERSKLRLQVSNGTNTDELLIYTDAQASNDFDWYDSPKMSNASAEIPEISCVVGAESLVINGLNAIPFDTELPLGFYAGTEGAYSIKANELTNLENVQVTLKDGANEFNLTNGNVYEFNSDAINSNSRFSLIFRTTGAVSALDNTKHTNTNVFVNANGEIVVKTTSALSANANVAVYNAFGQLVNKQPIINGKAIINVARTAGVYFVTVRSDGKTSTQKLIYK